MAEELPPQEELEKTEGVEAPEAEAAPAPDPIEQLAREKGWSSKEDWRGPEDQWRPARDFLSYGWDRGKTASRDMREMREQVERTERTVTSMAQQAIAKAREEAGQRFREAVEAKDHVAAAEAVRDLHSVQPVQPGPDPAVADFQARNRWFGSDQAATLYAEYIAEQAHRQGLSARQQVEKAEAAVRERFPQLFEAPRPAAKPQASVAAPGSRSAPTRAKGFNDLPAAAQDTGRRMAGKLGITLEDYAKTWLSENAA